MAVFIPAVTGVFNPRNWSHIHAINNFAEHVNGSSSGISATITYNAFSLGASHADAKTNHYSSYSSYIDVDKGVIGDAAFIVTDPNSGPIKPTLLALKALKAKDAARQFTRRCGQAFVSAVYFGERVHGSMDFVTQMNSSAESNSTSVSASIGKIVGGSYLDSSSWSDVQNKSQISYNVEGGPAQDPEAKNWLKAIMDYGSDGAYNQARQEVLVVTTPYSVVADPAFDNFVDPATESQASVLKFRSDYMDGVQELTDLYLARNNAGLFDTPLATTPSLGTPASSPSPPGAVPPPQVVSITDRIEKLEKYLDDAGRVYLDCRKAVTTDSADTCADEAKNLDTKPFYPPLRLKPQPTGTGGAK
jgi:hypothetical protein